MKNEVMSHVDWRKLHPTEHPLWCQYAVTGKLQPCDCDLAYPQSQSDAEVEPKAR
jgi:hypothetical protein